MEGLTNKRLKQEILNSDRLGHCLYLISTEPTVQVAVVLDEGSLLFEIPDLYPMVAPIVLLRPTLNEFDWNPILTLEKLSLALLCTTD